MTVDNKLKPKSHQGRTMRLLEHKKEVIAAVIGALTGGLLAFLVGYYSLNKSFQMSQSKELLLGLRSDISILKNVDHELDENMKLLLSNSYQIKVEFEPYEFKLPSTGAQKRDKDFDKWMKEAMQAMVGKNFIIKVLQIPPDRFIVGSWQVNGPNSTDIDFELVQALNELNRKFLRANGYLEQLSRLAPGMHIDDATKNGLEKNNPRFNSTITEISQTTLVQIKNRITEEIKKLQKRRDEISL